MTPAEAAIILSIAATLDPRLKPASAQDAELRAKAWAATLDDDMPVAFGRDAVTGHYAESDRGIMPADVNRAWRTYRREKASSDRQGREMHAIMSAEAMAVPMPEEVRRKLQEVLNKTRIPDE